MTLNHILLAIAILALACIYLFYLHFNSPSIVQQGGDNSRLDAIEKKVL